MQNIRERLVAFNEKNNPAENRLNPENDQVEGESDIKIRKDQKDWNAEIIIYLQSW